MRILGKKIQGTGCLILLVLGACSKAANTTDDAPSDSGVDSVNGIPIVDSINNKQGAVSLGTDDIPEGATSKYYTDARVAAAPSVQSKESGLGNPAASGQILSSNNSGARSWIYGTQAIRPNRV